MSDEIIPAPTTELAPLHLAAAGKAANAAAARRVFADHRQSITDATVRAQQTDLIQFAEALGQVAGVTLDGAALATDPVSWCSVTWGMVAAYRKWLVDEGFATASINRKLATLKKYAELAAQAGTLPDGEVLKIRNLSGYTGKQARNLDAQRATIRRGSKKADWTRISFEEAQQLKDLPDAATPVGRRDRLLLALLINHGLRVSEVAALDVSAINLAHNTLTAYRQKTHETTTHYLEASTRSAACPYLMHDAPAVGPLFAPATKTGRLRTGQRLTVRGIRGKVLELGQQLGLAHLSPHDLRHFGALERARRRMDSLDIADWGNWKSLHMVQRYRGEAKIGNERTMLEDDANE